MAIIKKDKNFAKDIEKREVLCTVGRMQIDPVTVENSTEVP